MNVTQFADAARAIFNQLEEESTTDDDPYRKRIESLMAAEFEREDVDRMSDAKHLRETTGGFALEEAARQTGFVLGLEYCRGLVLRGKGGAK